MEYSFNKSYFRSWERFVYIIIGSQVMVVNANFISSLLLLCSSKLVFSLRKNSEFMQKKVFNIKILIHDFVKRPILQKQFAMLFSKYSLSKQH